MSIPQLFPGERRLVGVTKLGNYLVSSSQAFTGYLGSVEAGKAYDATELVRSYSGPKPSILIDQGTADGFLRNQLKPENFAAAAAEAGYPCQVRLQPLYDHSYYMISTFMRDHIDHHARALGLRAKL